MQQNSINVLSTAKSFSLKLIRFLFIGETWETPYKDISNVGGDSHLGICQLSKGVIILTEEGPNFGVMCPHYQARRVQKVIDNVHSYHKNNHNWQVWGNIISW